MSRAITKCPNCDEPVTQFAAGCSICGEDLLAARARRAARRAPLSAISSRLRLPAISDEALRVGIALVLALFIPFFGLILAGFFAWQAHNDGRSGLRNLLLAVAALAAVLITFAPVGIWWRLVN